MSELVTPVPAAPAIRMPPVTRLPKVFQTIAFVTARRWTMRHHVSKYGNVFTLNIPIWNWGATRSKVKQAEFRAEQAQADLDVAEQATLLAGVDRRIAWDLPVASWRGSVDPSRRRVGGCP